MDSNLLEAENYEIFDSNKLEEEFDCLREGEPDDDDDTTAPRFRGNRYILTDAQEKEFEEEEEEVEEEYFPREGEEGEKQVEDEEDIPMSWVNIELDIDGHEGESIH